MKKWQWKRTECLLWGSLNMGHMKEEEEPAMGYVSGSQIDEHAGMPWDVTELSMFQELKGLRVRVQLWEWGEVLGGREEAYYQNLGRYLGDQCCAKPAPRWVCWAAGGLVGLVYEIHEKTMWEHTGSWAGAGTRSCNRWFPVWCFLIDGLDLKSCLCWVLNLLPIFYAHALTG